MAGHDIENAYGEINLLGALGSRYILDGETRITDAIARQDIFEKCYSA